MDRPSWTSTRRSQGTFDLNIIMVFCLIVSYCNITFKILLKSLLEMICKIKINDLLCDLKIEILKTKNWWVRFFMILTAHQYLVTLKWIIRTWSEWFWALRFGMWKWISYDVAYFKKIFFKFWTDSSLFFVALKLKCSF